jgi:hypothetical protein
MASSYQKRAERVVSAGGRLCCHGWLSFAFSFYRIARVDDETERMLIQVEVYLFPTFIYPSMAHFKQTKAIPSNT